MSGQKKVFKAGGLYLIGNIFDKAVAFITVPIFTRLLTTSEYGVVSTYTSWVSILTVLLTLSVGNSVRMGVVDFNESSNQYISSIFALGSLSALIMGAFILIVSRALLTSYDFVLVLLCVIQAYASSIIQSVQIKHMMDLKYVQRTILQCVPNIIGIVLSILMIKRMNDFRYMGKIIPVAILFFAIALLYVIYYFCKGRTFFNRKYWKYAITFSLPIIFHNLSTVILQQADRSMITWLRNSSETGIYGLAYQFGMVPLVVTTTLENVWIPWFTRKMEAGDKKDINKMVVPYINVVTIMCAGIMLFAPEVLKLMTTPGYYSAVYMIAPVVAATFLTFLASVSLDLEYYLKKTKSIASNTLVAAVINIVLNYIFIPKFGGTAAAYTTVVSYAVSFMMHYLVARKLDKELFVFKIYIIPILLMAAFTATTTILMDYAFIRWGIGVVLGIVFIVFGYRLIKS